MLGWKGSQPNYSWRAPRFFMARNIIDTWVLQTCSADNLLERTIKWIPKAKDQFTIGWAFGNACIMAWMEAHPNWLDLPEAEVYVEWFELFTIEQITELKKAWDSYETHPPRP